MKVTLIVKCIGCEHKRAVKSEEEGKSDPPMCEKCFNMMVADSAVAE
jgi:hypothetical protein